MKCGKYYMKIIVHKFVNFMLICVALYLIISSILYYSSWPIYTATNVIAQNEAQLPAVTFCGLWGGYKENVLRVIMPNFVAPVYQSSLCAFNLRIHIFLIYRSSKYVYTHIYIYIYI